MILPHRPRPANGSCPPSPSQAPLAPKSALIAGTPLQQRLFVAAPKPQRAAVVVRAEAEVTLDPLERWATQSRPRQLRS